MERAKGTVCILLMEMMDVAGNRRTPLICAPGPTRLYDHMT